MISVFDNDPTDPVDRQLLKSVLATIEDMRLEVKALNAKMVEIVRIEEQVLNQKEGMSRMGKHIDKQEREIEKIKIQLNLLEGVSGRLVAKISAIASGVATLAIGVGLAVFQYYINTGLSPAP